MSNLTIKDRFQRFSKWKLQRRRWYRSELHSIYDGYLDEGISNTHWLIDYHPLLFPKPNGGKIFFFKPSLVCCALRPVAEYLYLHFCKWCSHNNRCHVQQFLFVTVNWASSWVLSWKHKQSRISQKKPFLRCTRKLECAYKNVNNRLVLHTRRRLQQQQHNLIARNLESVQNFCFSAWSLVLPKKSRMTVTSMRRMSPNNVHFSPKLFGRPMKTVLNKPFYVQ